ncbi:MAG: hypothetical protein WCF19_01360 [Chlamydiales bacterium]
MLAVILAAAIAFDSSMTDEEWEQTGLIKLTLQERMALQEWMEERYSKKMAAQDKKSAPVLQEVLKNGRFVRLSDHSLWEIDGQDTPITQGWITPAEISAASNGDAAYPYTLTNSLTGSTVRARKAQSINPGK